MMDNTFITVMVPVRNEEKFILTTLEQLYEQSYPKDRYEVLVIDGMSDDRTVELVDEFSRDREDFDVKVFVNENRLSSSARNIAVKNGKGDYFLLIDGHVYIPSCYLLKAHDEAIKATGALVMGRAQPLDPPRISRFQKLVSLVRGSRLAHSRESYIYSTYDGWVSPISVAVMYHKSLFSEVGYFDSSFDAAEDLEFNYRLEKAGYKCYLSSEFTVKYYPRDSISALFKQMCRYGKGRANFIRKHQERRTFEAYVPAIFLVLCMTLLFAALVSSEAFVWGGVLGASYFLITWAELMHLKFDNVLYKLAVGPVLYITIYCGLGAGFLRAVLFSFYSRR